MKRVRMGMVGGGQNAFIGSVHRMAAALDGKIDLVCGAFSRDHQNTLKTGRSLGLDESRLYKSYQDMFDQEAKLPLADVIEQTGVHYGLTHTYLGYPMVWQAQYLAAQPEFGAIRKVYVEYPQGWLAQDQENAGSKQAEWRTDPARSGLAGCMGDIGTHAHSLAEFVTQSRMTEIAARLRTHVEGRLLDDDGEMSFTLANGATGVLTSSQVCVGEENSLKIRVYGENRSLEWHQMEPNTLIERRADGPYLIHRAGVDKPLCDAALAKCRLPSGHPEGYIEAFANLYREFAVESHANNGIFTKIEGAS